MQQIKPIEPQRDRDGYWTHPDVPGIETSEQFNVWQAEQGFQCSVVMLESDDGEGSEDAQKRYFEDGDTDILCWQPSKPEGEGWFIVSIHDTEDGPACLWIRYPTEDQQCGNDEEAPGDGDTPEDEGQQGSASFSAALMWLKEGKRVARAGWNAGGQWAAMRFARADKLIGFADDERLYLEGDGFILKNAQDVLVPWVPSVGDLLATDWQVVKA